MTEYKYIDYFGENIGVSKNGKVFWNGAERNIYYNADGYAVCSIKLKEKGWRQVRVARLVAIAYIPNPENLPEVNHKDFDRTNSNVDNLEWISRKDNVRYSICNKPDMHGKNNPNYGNDKLSKIYSNDKELSRIKQGRPGLKNGRCRKIKMFRDGVLIKEFDYIVECCKYIIENYSNGASIGGVRSQIDKSIRNGSKYKGFDFIKE